LSENRGLSRPRMEVPFLFGPGFLEPLRYRHVTPLLS